MQLPPWQPSERMIRTLPMAVTGLWLSFLANFLFLYTRSRFLEVLGASALPTFYIALNLMTIGCGIVLFFGKVPSMLGMRGALAAMALCLLLLSPALPGAAALMALSVAAGLFLVLSMLFFWSMISQALSFKDLERVGPNLGASTLSGAILAGLLVQPIVTFVPSTTICVAGAILLAVSAFLLPEPTSSPRRSLALTAELLPNVLFESRLVKLLLVMALAIGTMRFLSEYQFSHALAERFQDTSAIAAYLGRLHAGINALILLWQLLLSRRFLTAWRVTNLYLVSSGVLLVVTLAATAGPGLLMFTAHQVVFLLLLKAIHQPSQALALKVLPSTLIERANFLLGGLAEAMTALGAAALIVLFDRLGLDARAYFVVASGLGAIALYASTRLPWPYMTMLLQRLQRDGDPRGTGLLS